MRNTHVASSVVDVLRVATDGGARELRVCQIIDLGLPKCLCCMSLVLPLNIDNMLVYRRFHRLLNVENIAGSGLGHGLGGL